MTAAPESQARTADPKRIYRKPRLQRFGDVAQWTAGTMTASNDMGGPGKT